MTTPQAIAVCVGLAAALLLFALILHLAGDDDGNDDDPFAQQAIDWPIRGSEQ